MHRTLLHLLKSLKKLKKSPANDTSKGSATPKKAGPVLDLTDLINGLEQYINHNMLALFDQVNIYHLAFKAECIGPSEILCHSYYFLNLVFCLSMWSTFR